MGNQIIHFEINSPRSEYDNGFQRLPLQVASMVGLDYLIWFLVLIYVVGRYIIQGGAVPGFHSCIYDRDFSGAQLFA